MAALVLAEHDGHVLKPATLNAVAAALLLGGPVDLLVAGDDVRPVAEAGAAIAGVEKVLLADDPLYAHLLAETVAPLLTGLAQNYEAVLAAATTFGKNVLPRVAATLDVQQISEITAVISTDTFVRPIYAGNALATVRSKDALKICITVRCATAFAACGRLRWNGEHYPGRPSAGRHRRQRQVRAAGARRLGASGTHRRPRHHLGRARRCRTAKTSLP